MNHIIVDMRFNQVIRAELRAGEYGPGVPEYQAGLGAGLSKWKSHLRLSWGAASLVVAGALPSFRPLSVQSAQL